MENGKFIMAIARSGKLESIRQAIIDSENELHKYADRFMQHLNCTEEIAHDLAAICIRRNVTPEQIITAMTSINSLWDEISKALENALEAFKHLYKDIIQEFPQASGTDAEPYTRIKKIISKKSRVVVKRIIRSRSRESHRKSFEEEEEVQ